MEKTARWINNFIQNDTVICEMKTLKYSYTYRKFVMNIDITPFQEDEIIVDNIDGFRKKRPAKVSQ